MTRQAELVAAEVQRVPSPWMAADAPRVIASPIRPLVVEDVRTRVSWPAGAFPDEAGVRLADLSTQALPGLLPPGWSPLAAFRLQTESATRSNAVAELLLGDVLRPTDEVALIAWQEDRGHWRVLARPDGEGASLRVELSSVGTFGVVVGDAGAPTPMIGEALPGLVVEPVDPAGWSAEGKTLPPSRLADLVPEEVTATAQIGFQHPDGPVSGQLFPTLVRERYQLVDGRLFGPPPYDTDIVAFRRPGSGTGLFSFFPLRPQTLFARHELEVARIELDILSPASTASGILDERGGRLEGPDATLDVPAGALSGIEVVEILPLDPSRLGPDALSFFQLNIGGFEAGSHIVPDFPPQEAHAFFLLVEVISNGDLRPLRRYGSDSTGELHDLERANPPRLPGIGGGGQFALLRLGGPLGLLTGIALNTGGEPETGLELRVDGVSWSALTGADGSFLMPAPVPGGLLRLIEPGNGNEDEAAYALADGGSVQTLALQAGPTGPRVLHTEPADGATGVRLVAGIEVVFSESVNPGSLAAAGLTLDDAVGNPVPGGLSLALDNRSATFLPTDALAADTVYTLTVAPDVADLEGLTLSGPNAFTFRTRPEADRDPGAEFVVYEPGATNCPCVGTVPGYDPTRPSIVCVQGSAGTADPGAAVILVNEMNGNTATVVAEVDGSFLNFIQAEEGDFVSATFDNLNGTRVNINATRQLFDDGRVGLYKAGGILEAESDNGPVQILVEPGAIPQRSRFRLTSVSLEDIFNAVNGIQPIGGQLLGGVEFEQDLDALDVAADIVFPFELDQIDGDAAGKSFVLTRPFELDGEVVYQVLDEMRFEDLGGGKAQLVTRSPPYVGILAQELRAMSENARRLQPIAVDVRNASAGAAQSAPPIMMTPMAINASQAGGSPGRCWRRNSTHWATFSPRRSPWLGRSWCSAAAPSVAGRCCRPESCSPCPSATAPSPSPCALRRRWEGCGSRRPTPASRSSGPSPPPRPTAPPSRS